MQERETLESTTLTDRIDATSRLLCISYVFRDRCGGQGSANELPSITMTCYHCFEDFGDLLDVGLVDEATSS